MKKSRPGAQGTSKLYDKTTRKGKDLPVSDKDLPAVQDISQGDTAVLLPLLQDLQVINEDDEVLGLTLEEDLVSVVVGARHLDG